MNPLDDRLITGTIGELLVQIRLLQYGVQAAPPLKDSGNDLIAIRGATCKAIQVKTTCSKKKFEIPKNRRYDTLALVRLSLENNQLFLDNTGIYLLSRELIDSNDYNLSNIEEYRLSQEVVDLLIPYQ